MEQHVKKTGLLSIIVELNSDRDRAIKKRLAELAMERRQSVTQLVLSILEEYLEKLPGIDGGL